ncbi:phosphonate C-P lyase [Mycolicibacterium wolinskyi]|uniref:Phosphonate C-P lyase n=1 Tax=Mycolicibacterium wolinskyi TaxID=59750 RepID=A0A132PIS0_9MYCO|nr:phosphonate C-P lyase system protein PhnH [Mycolicibacterium wolinskyi]KWX21902.1 phosphonate C-P lyase [Mycolicibacterium wolinskyi]
MTWDPVHDSRSVFVACMRAMCAPGTPIELPSRPRITPVAELDGAAAVLLALLDRGLALGVAGGEAAHGITATVAGTCGAAQGDIEDSDWVLVHGPAADAISRARRGSRLTPENGATLVIAATGAPVPVALTGPGIAGTTTAHVALDTVAVHALAAANAAPPCGVDVLMVDGECLIALPRSASLKAAA